eukprot:gene2170-2347_t
MLLPLPVSLAAAAANYTELKGYNCYHGHGGVDIDSAVGAPGTWGMTIPECEARCDATPGCACFVATVNMTAGGGAAGSCLR